MSEIRRKDIWFDSANGESRVAGYFYTCEDMPPKAILQISHGMCEYLLRYAPFAQFMSEHGYAVVGNDHLGHGATSGEGLDGYFASERGGEFVLKDLHTMNQKAHEAFPGLPLILLGHSMGSFFARLFAAVYPDDIDALLISGTGGPNPAATLGITLTEWIGRVKGGQYVSPLVQKMGFGNYLARIPSPNTPYDWISRDEEMVRAYAADPKCTFQFTVSAFHELLLTLHAVSSPRWAERLKKETPVLLFSGDADPVGDYGKGVRKVYDMLRQAGVEDVRLKLYPGGRHEMLNETNRAEVYADVLAWCEEHLRA